MEVEDQIIELVEDDVITLSPSICRQLTALENSRIPVVGAPNVDGDGVIVGQG